MRPPRLSSTRARPRDSASGLMFPPLLFQKPPNQASDPSICRVSSRESQIDRGTDFRPLPHPPLGDLDAPGRVNRLNPTGLFLLGLNLIAPREIEQDGGTVTHQTDKTFTRCPMPGNDVLRVMPR